MIEEKTDSQADTMVTLRSPPLPHEQSSSWMNWLSRISAMLDHPCQKMSITRPLTTTSDLSQCIKSVHCLLNPTRAMEN